MKPGERWLIDVKRRRCGGWRVIVQDMVRNRAYVSPPGDELDDYRQAMTMARSVRDQMAAGLA